MEMNLQPQGVNEVVFEGEDGAYYSWSPSKLPVLDESKVGAGKLVLQPRGFALPHYADSTKIGFVVQGKFICNCMFPLMRVLVSRGYIITTTFILTIQIDH